MAGIFLTRGSRFGLTISTGGDGQITSGLTLHVSYDQMYYQWLRIAIEQSELCSAAAKAVDALWTDGSRQVEIDALETELRAGMQACVAAAIAIDGFYGTVVDRAPVPDDMKKRWRKGHLARYKQIAEALRRSFEIGPKTFVQVRDFLKTLFMFRDEAVHPTAAIRAPVPHPRLSIAAEQRLVMYVASNAFNAAEMALKIIGILLDHPKPKHAALVEHCEIAKTWVYPVVDEWEAKHGELFPRGGSSRPSSSTRSKAHSPPAGRADRRSRHRHKRLPRDRSRRSAP
jgi:hypothetical protein